MRENEGDKKSSQDAELPDSSLEAIVGGVKGDTQDPPPK